MQTVQRLAPVLGTLLFALAGWLSALLCWEVVALVVEEPVVGRAQVAAPVPAQAGYDLSALTSVALFGEPRQAAAPSAVSAETVKRSNLRIDLLGVVAGGDRGVAVLRHDGKEYAYRVGDRLDVSETITLAAVAPEYVIIARAGGREKIELEQSKGRKLAGGELRVVNRSGPVAATVDLNDPSIRRLIGDPKQTLNSNPLRLTRYISAQPHMENGKVVGFVVQPGRDKRLFSQLGLEAGDVVLSVNGNPVGEAAASDLLNSVNNSQSVEVQLLRNGLQQTIRLNL